MYITEVACIIALFLGMSFCINYETLCGFCIIVVLFKVCGKGDTGEGKKGNDGVGRPRCVFFCKNFMFLVNTCCALLFCFPL